MPGLLLMLNSCGLPDYLPKPARISENHYGAYAIVDLEDRSRYKGELLSVNDSCLYLLELWPEATIHRLARDRVTQYELVYAEGTDYTLAFIGVAAISATHGIFAVISYPVNFIAVAVIQYWRRSPYTLKTGNSEWSELGAYARFPQGLPPNVNLSEIKPPGEP